jgi:hypothetical protein
VLDAEREHRRPRVAVSDRVIVEQPSPSGNPIDLGSLGPRRRTRRFA